MRSFSAILSGLAALALAQTPVMTTSDAPSLTSSSQPTGTEALEQEERVAECFVDCYVNYGNFTNCPFGDEFERACWCEEPDWVRREEDCVWDVCGVSAHNNYADIYSRMCQTVMIPTALPTSSAPTTTTVTSTVANMPTPTPSDEGDDNGAAGWSKGTAAGIAVGFVYLARLLL